METHPRYEFWPDECQCRGVAEWQNIDHRRLQQPPEMATYARVTKREIYDPATEKWTLGRIFEFPAPVSFGVRYFFGRQSPGLWRVAPGTGP